MSGMIAFDVFLVIEEFREPGKRIPVRRIAGKAIYDGDVDRQSRQQLLWQFPKVYKGTRC
jgi:hypothetical protein